MPGILFRSHLDEAEFRKWFITGPNCVACLVAETPDGSLGGFQACERYHLDLPARWADVATFVEGTARGAGLGRRLFSQTLARTAGSDITMLRAVVRAGNHHALAYYRGLGFAEPSSSGDGSARSQDSSSVTFLRAVAGLRSVPQGPFSVSREDLP